MIYELIYIIGTVAELANTYTRPLADFPPVTSKFHSLFFLPLQGP